MSEIQEHARVCTDDLPWVPDKECKAINTIDCETWATILHEKEAALQGNPGLKEKFGTEIRQIIYEAEQKTLRLRRGRSPSSDASSTEGGIEHKNQTFSQKQAKSVRHNQNPFATPTKVTCMDDDLIHYRKTKFIRENFENPSGVLTENKLVPLTIDARYSYEYNGGHIPGAININLQSVGTKLFIDCRSYLRRKSFVNGLKLLSGETIDSEILKAFVSKYRERNEFVTCATPDLTLRDKKCLRTLSSDLNSSDSKNFFCDSFKKKLKDSNDKPNPKIAKCDQRTSKRTAKRDKQESDSVRGIKPMNLQNVEDVIFGDKDIATSPSEIFTPNSHNIFNSGP
jgi:hypothetical protein